MALLQLMQAIANPAVADAAVLAMITPELAREAAHQGATRSGARDFCLAPRGIYVYAGHTALHVAAGSYRLAAVSALLEAGADVHARNRRGAEPLHAAAMGMPGAPWWNPTAQAAAIERLVAAGARVDSGDKLGVTPLHKAVRCRCAAAVRALMAAGADPKAKTGRGSTAIEMAGRTTGRGGSGSAEARAEQEEILRLFGASRSSAR
jgi:hypothetical protein